LSANNFGNLTKSETNHDNETGFLDKSRALFLMVWSAISDFQPLVRKLGFFIKNHPARPEIDLGTRASCNLQPGAAAYLV
jgi:hypothetical protein